MPKLAEHWVEIGAKLDDFEKGMSNVDKATKKIGKSIESVGKNMTKYITLPIMAAGIASIKLGVDFNKAMANVATLIPGNTKRVNELKKSVQDMAMATGKSSDDIAGGLYQVISAFQDSADTAKILDINVRAATAGLSTTTDAINLTSAVTKGYGDVTAEAVQKAADLAFITVKLGQTTFPELAQSIGSVVPLASQLGVKQEELFAGFATLTGVTGKANEVSTQFAAILRGLIKQTEDMKAAIKSVGEQIGLEGKITAEALIQNLGLKETFEALVKTTDGTTQSIAKLFQRTEGLTGLIPLLTSQSKTYNEKLFQMKRNVGATDEAFREMTTGVNELGFRLNQLKETLKVTGQEIGDELAPTLMRISDRIEKTVHGFMSLDENTRKVIVRSAMFTAALGPLILGFGKFIRYLPFAKAGILSLGRGFIAFMNPVGLAAAAIVGIVISINNLIKTLDKAKKSMSNFATEALIFAKDAENFRKLWIAAQKEGGVYWEQFDELMKRFGGNWEDILKQIVSDPKYGTLKGLLLDIVKGIKDVGTEAQNLSITLPDQFLKGAKVDKATLEAWQEYLEAINVLDVEQKSKKLETLQKMVVLTNKAYEDGKLDLASYQKAISALQSQMADLTSVQESWTNFLKVTGIKTIKEKSQRLKELNDYLKLAGEALKDGKIDLASYQKAVAAVSDEIKELTDVQKPWIEFLREAAIKTIEEKSKRVKELQKILKDLDQAYKEGRLDIKDYSEVQKLAKEELEALATEAENTAIAIRTASATLGGPIIPPAAINIPKMSLEDFKEYYEQWIEDFKEKLEELKRSWENIFYSMAFVVGNFFTQIGTLSQVHFDNQLIVIEKEMDAFNKAYEKRTEKLDEYYDAEREKIENSLMSEQEKAAALVALEEEKNEVAKKLAEEKAKEEEKYEAKKKAVQKKAFESQKKISLVTAAINIAEAITKALTGAIPPWNFILAGLAAAAGAVQIAAISAQTFPGLEKGGWLPKPMVVEAGHGPRGEIVAQPAMLAKIITQEMPRAISPEPALTPVPIQPIVNIYAQKLDRDTIDRAGEEIMRAVNRARNRGL